MTSSVRQVVVTCLALVPSDFAVLPGGLLRAPDGATYTVGPALYLVTPDPRQQVSTVVPGQGAPNRADYLPYESWPAGLELDDTVMARIGPPIPAEQGADAPAVGPGRPAP